MPDPFAPLQLAYAHWSSNHVSAALQVLDECREQSTPTYCGEWHRLRGLCQQSLGDYAAAETSFQTGLSTTSLGQRGRLHLSYAALLEYRQRPQEALEHHFAAEHLCRQTRDAESTVAATHNISGVLLQLGRFTEAGETLDAALCAPGGTRDARSLLQAGRSVVALTAGQTDLATQRARLAAQTANHTVYRQRALQVLVTALSAAEQHTDARAALRDLTSLPGSLTDPALRASTDVLRAVLDEDPTQLAHTDPAAHPAWQARALLHRTRWATDPAQAQAWARAAHALHQRHEEAIFQLTHPDVHAALVRGGVPLATAGPRRATTLSVTVRGELRLSVDGVPVNARLPAATAALVAALISDGPLTTSELCRDVLGAADPGAPGRAAERLRTLIGDPCAVTLSGAGPTARWTLHARYTWQIDAAQTGQPLGGLSSTYAQQLALA